MLRVERMGHEEQNVWRVPTPAEGKKEVTYGWQGDDQVLIIGSPHSQKKTSKTPTLSPFIDHSRNIILAWSLLLSQRQRKHNIDLPQKSSHTHSQFHWRETCMKHRKQPPHSMLLRLLFFHLYYSPGLSISVNSQTANFFSYSGGSQSWESHLFTIAKGIQILFQEFLGTQGHRKAIPKSHSMVSSRRSVRSPFSKLVKGLANQIA